MLQYTTGSQATGVLVWVCPGLTGSTDGPWAVFLDEQLSSNLAVPSAGPWGDSKNRSCSGFLALLNPNYTYNIFTAPSEWQPRHGVPCCTGSSIQLLADGPPCLREPRPNSCSGHQVPPGHDCSIASEPCHCWCTCSAAFSNTGPGASGFVKEYFVNVTAVTVADVRLGSPGRLPCVPPALLRSSWV